MKPAKLICVDGTQRQVKPLNGAYFTFEELYPLIEADMIQMLPLGGGMMMLMDEDGKVRAQPKPRNDLATVIADRIRADDYIVGNVVVCDRRMLR